MRTVLVTGGAGYVGSHCCKAFATDGWRVVCLDNLSRGWRETVRWGPLIEGNIADEGLVRSLLHKIQPDLIAHFAAYAYVGESVIRPEIYYENNMLGTFKLLEAVRSVGPIPFLFSSTCATFGHPQKPLIDEHHPQWPINPYGWSKLMVERMLADHAMAHNLTSISLRYFNAAGADPEGEIGERHEPETHAIPLAIGAALRGDTPFPVLGTDFSTQDGSAVRDYIHVADLASAHVLAARRILGLRPAAEAFNLGTGKGTSVLELVAAVGRVSGREPPVRVAPRRSGDPAVLVADPARSQAVLGWYPERSDIDTIVADALRWATAQGRDFTRSRSIATS